MIAVGFERADRPVDAEVDTAIGTVGMTASRWT